MKHTIITAALALFTIFGMAAQSTRPAEGNCGKDCHWTFDGRTLTITNTNKKGLDVEIDNYNTTTDVAPWKRKNLNVVVVNIGRGIERIGSCAFANMEYLQEVKFDAPGLREIGWGAFLGDYQLRTISIPPTVNNIETIAFANCNSLSAIKIPDHCTVGEQAFASCTNLKSVEISPTAMLGQYVFASEVSRNGKTRHALYNGEVRRIPAYINTENCNEYGLARTSVEKLTGKAHEENYDYITSELDSIIPLNYTSRYNTYALVIGNQNYRFASNVPYAIHDARIFSKYCQQTLGIPAENIHLMEDATKQMILEEAIQDWLKDIPNPQDKNLIVYYAGHGVPDLKDKRAYLLPTDVRGTSPKRGIALDEFYSTLGDLAFNQTTVFLDACFSGVNRDSEGVVKGLRAVEIDTNDADVGNGNLVVFSAAQGNETAQGYPQEGHGLFTYYLLQKLNDSRGRVTLGDLSTHILNGVTRQAPQLKLRKDQTPTTTPSARLATSWQFIYL